VIAVQHALGVVMTLLVATLAARCFSRRPAGSRPARGAVRAGLFPSRCCSRKSERALAVVLALHLWLDVLQDQGARRAALLGLVRRPAAAAARQGWGCCWGSCC
jgi:hypothetical protein